MKTPDISEGAFAVARALFPELCTGLSDDTSDFYEKAAIIQTALDSAHPAPMEGGKTPETDAAVVDCLMMDVPPSCVVDAAVARSLERRLAEKTREVEMLDQDRLRTISELNAQLKKANELLGAAERYVPMAAFFGDIANRPMDEVRLVTRIRAHLNQQTK